MDTELNRILDYINGHRESMIDLWKHLVEIESPSADREAVEKIASHLDTYTDSLGLKRKIYHFEKSGPVFTACTKETDKAPVTIIGHMDTVHPVGSFGPELFRIEDGKVTGPGVFDMKGGLVVGIFAVRALLAAGYDRRQLRLVFSGDEEVAHAYSDGEGGRLLGELAKGSVACFNCESGYDGDVVIGRKGGAIFNVKVTGKAAHAGKEPEKGASAILQAARMIVEMESRSSKDRVLYNCGRITGGKGANVIPDYCEFSVGIRYRTNCEFEEAKELIGSLAEKPFVKGTSCEVSTVGFYPAFETSEENERLLKVYQRGCSLLGDEIPKGIRVGGCSDSSFTALAGVPTICSCGVIGHGAHAKDESALIDSVVSQCRRLATAIYLLDSDTKEM